MSSFLYTYFDFLQENIKNPNLYLINKNHLNIPFNNFKHLLSFFALFIYPENHESIYNEIFNCNEDDIDKLLKEYQNQKLSYNTINNLYSYIFSYSEKIVKLTKKIEYDKTLYIFCYRNLYIQNPLKMDIIITCFKLKLEPSLIIQYDGNISSLLKILYKTNKNYFSFISAN
ncbi:hypothetical protein H8356DRAFT_554098 [Neocallimastix lanati (nom. inval.)]|nr:hypothetical protein H8356DRAFT_554098 [Neocallimastix sp. JGI-2020a]